MRPPAPREAPDGRALVVLYLDNSFTFGGAINSLLHMLRGFDPGCIRPVVVTGQERAFVRSRLPGAECVQVRLSLPWIHDRWYRRLLSVPPFRAGAGRRLLGRARALYWLLFKTLPEALRYAAIGRRYGVDVVHLNNNLESQLSGMLAARLLRVPCIAHSRSFQRPDWSLRAYDRLVTRHVAISTAIAGNLANIGIAREKIAVVHDAIDLEDFDPSIDVAPLREEFGIGADDPTFGLFGRVVPWKGTREFVEAARLVLRELPRARAFVVGDASDGAGEYLDDVRRLIRDAGLEDRVVLTGYRRDVAALMKLMNVIVHASTHPEPFGMVLIEGMAMGKPLVATEGGGPDDVVVPGRTGLVVRRGDPRALGDAIVELLRDPARAERMGRLGRERALHLFAKERYASEVYSLYLSALGRAGAPGRPHRPAPASDAARTPDPQESC